MRNGQNNKRMRGRNNNRGGGGGHSNNKGGHHQNPLTRVYESNGPDVKIRGTAHHIAEKYMQLARDASTSGDPVTAENLYQHAEHYLRLIAAAQDQFRQQNPYYQAPPAPNDGSGDLSFEDGDDDGQPAQQGQAQPYPIREPQPALTAPPQERPQQQERPQPQPQAQPQPQLSFEGHNGLPSFITGGQPQPVAAEANGHDAAQPAGERFPRRRRRHPRGPRAEGAAVAAPDDQRPSD